jgi:uncharacterized protein YprB with RNaseH-like and TPR domain
VGKPQRINLGDLKEFRIGFWDIETSGLAATFAGMFCATVKVLGQPPATYRIDESPNYKAEPWDDKHLCIQVRDELEQCQIAVGYNSNVFDLPFLNSRLIKHKERVVSPIVKHVDLYLVARYRMKLHSARLESLLEHLGTKTRKTPLAPETWRHAAAGSKKALNEVVAHNIPDVVALEEAFLRLIPLMDVQFRLVR